MQKRNFSLRIGLAELIVMFIVGVPAVVGESVQIRFEHAEFTGIEGAGITDLSWAIVTVTRTGDLDEISTVRLTTVDGTANATTDYYPQTDTVVFHPGESSKDVFIRLRSDFVYERTESFMVTLRNASPNVRISSPRTATVMINDELDYPRLFIGSDYTVEPASGSTAVKYMLIGVSNPSVETISVSFTTSDGTAVAGIDYEGTSGTLTIAPLVQQVLAPVTILGDSQNEPRETFNVMLSNPVNAIIDSSVGVTQIINHLPYRQHIDFDGDGYADLATFYSTNAFWFGGSSLHTYVTFGTPADVLVAADYTGDGRTDTAVWRPATGEWHILRSEDQSYFSFHFGMIGDIPAPADFDGDGFADHAVFRPSTGVWYISNSSDGLIKTIQFGRAGDRPTPTDYDGDWKADIAIYRPDAPDGSEWWIRNSSDNVVRVARFGIASDLTVAGDYSGDGRADIALWRPSTAQWFILRSEDGTYEVFVSGYPHKSQPAPGDYNAIGGLEAAELTVDKNTGTRSWHVRYDSVNSLSTGALYGNVPVATVNVH